MNRLLKSNPSLRRAFYAGGRLPVSVPDVVLQIVLLASFFLEGNLRKWRRLLSNRSACHCRYLADDAVGLLSDQVKREPDLRMKLPLLVVTLVITRLVHSGGAGAPHFLTFTPHRWHVREHIRVVRHHFTPGR
jgi:hypothetical protein